MIFNNEAISHRSERVMNMKQLNKDQTIAKDSYKRPYNGFAFVFTNEKNYEKARMQDKYQPRGSTADRCEDITTRQMTSLDEQLLLLDRSLEHSGPQTISPSEGIMTNKTHHVE